MSLKKSKQMLHTSFYCLGLGSNKNILEKKCFGWSVVNLVTVKSSSESYSNSAEKTTNATVIVSSIINVQ